MSPLTLMSEYLHTTPILYAISSDDIQINFTQYYFKIQCYLKESSIFFFYQ